MLIVQIEDLNEDHVKISDPYLVLSDQGQYLTGAVGHQNGRDRVFPIILARQEQQWYKNEILVV